jgi:hypothetical protein
MPSSTSPDRKIARLLDRLEAAKRAFGAAQEADIARPIGALGRRRFRDAGALIRFHEALLFFRAYPPNAEILGLADGLLASFARRITGDLTAFEEPDVSGIAGTAFSAIFTYDITRWLAARLGSSVEIDWDGCDATLLGPLLARLHPLYAEDALVEANIPYMDWFRAAKPQGRGSDLRWLIAQMERMPLTPEQRSEMFAGAKIAIRWDLGDAFTTRTRMRLPGARRFFYHRQPLIRRSEVSLANELASPPIPIEKMTHARGERMLDLARETSAMRYRELHGFTYGDPARVFRADLGRGIEVYVWGVPAAHRLPLRAYHCAMFFKNSVPLGYIECLTLCEHIEVGFNLYYTFREGETAWLYARLLHLFRQLLGVSCFAVDPYQLGNHNDEAIESGAFWFYRKLGFRPTDAQVGKLLDAEERKLRANPAYRTPASTLRRLSAGWMVYEMPGTSQGDWDNFEVRRVAMALRELPFPPRIERAKRGPDEAAYIRLLQQDARVRRKLIQLGSKSG